MIAWHTGKHTEPTQYSHTRHNWIMPLHDIYTVGGCSLVVFRYYFFNTDTIPIRYGVSWYENWYQYFV